MPLNISEIMSKDISICSGCNHLLDSDGSIYGYSHKCELLKGSAFDVIPDDVVEMRAIFDDCPKLIGTINEGNRYKVYNQRKIQN